MSNLSIKEYVFQKAARNRIPISGTFELTSRCNLNCKMCYIHMTPTEQSVFGSELTTAEWIRLGQAAVKEGMVYLLLTGGEPLLRPDFCHLYTELAKMGLLLSVNTNGTQITPEIVACFQRHKPEYVNVTLYGISANTYGELCGDPNGWEAALRGIRMLKEAGIRVNINTTLVRDNLQDMYRMIQFAKEIDVPIRTAAYIFPPVRNHHEPFSWVLSAEEMGKTAALFDLSVMDTEKIEKRKKTILHCVEQNVPDTEIQQGKRASCMAGRGAFWISWDGKMYPCGMIPNFSQDIRMADFCTAWKQTCESMAQVYLPKECSNCRYQKLCPSCAAVFLSVNGASNQLVPDLCERTKAYIDAFLGA